MKLVLSGLTLGILLFGIVGCGPSPGPVKRKMIGLIEKFDRWDYNGDGLLEKSELKDAQIVSGVDEDTIIKFYDTDADGKISRLETQKAPERIDTARDILEEEGVEH